MQQKGINEILREKEREELNNKCKESLPTEQKIKVSYE